MVGWCEFWRETPRFGATQNTINFDQQNLGNKKKWGSTKFHSLFLGFCLAGAQLLGKWPCFAHQLITAHQLETSPSNRSQKLPTPHVMMSLKKNRGWSSAMKEITMTKWAESQRTIHLSVTACSLQGALPVAKHLWSCQAHGSYQELAPHSGGSLPFKWTSKMGNSWNGRFLLRYSGQPRNKRKYTGEPRKKPGLTFHYTGLFIGILIRVYYNLHITG